MRIQNGKKIEGKTNKHNVKNVLFAVCFAYLREKKERKKLNLWKRKNKKQHSNKKQHRVPSNGANMAYGYK